jgi:exonuclease V
MYGSINGYKLVGRIDQLEREGGKVVISEDKTKANGKLPSNAQVLTNRVQLMLYRKMLDDLIGKQYDAKNFARAYSIDRLKLTDEFLRQLKALDIGQELMNLYSVSEAFFEMFPKLGKVNDSMKLVYRDQATGDKINIYSFDYNEEEARDIVTYVLKFWNGERKSKPVPENEKWKCSFCRFFGKECTVWWPQRELDA